MGQPFNGDTFIEQEFLNLKERFELTTAVETGTFEGDTTLWLANNFLKVVSCELDHNRVVHARQKFADAKVHVEMFEGSSDACMNWFIPHNGVGHDTIFFLDAHWNDYCPLLEELEAINRYNLHPVIAIHDFKEPTGKLGYDSYNGHDFCLEYIKPKLDEIYRAKTLTQKYGYSYYYNHPSRATGAMRGIIYILPNR